MLLYAGNTSISSFKYSPFKDIVKNQSAGNTFKVNLKSGTSETICDNTETIKNISIHVATHLKPLNDEQFGHYLAGLIDGDGHFSSEATKQQLVIVFSSPDVKLAYYIKEVIGFGNVKKVKDKNAYLYIISNKEGLFRVINLINAGFSDADASFQIKIITRDDKPRPEIRLNYQVVRSAKKDNPILLLLKEFFGGNIGYRSSQGTYYYGSTSFGSAKK
ncbi:unnamed protein product, partial [Fusarium graminearum]